MYTHSHGNGFVPPTAYTPPLCPPPPQGASLPPLIVCWALCVLGTRRCRLPALGLKTPRCSGLGIASAHAIRTSVCPWLASPLRPPPPAPCQSHTGFALSLCRVSRSPLLLRSRPPALRHHIRCITHLGCGLTSPCLTLDPFRVPFPIRPFRSSPLCFSNGSVGIGIARLRPCR